MGKHSWKRFAGPGRDAQLLLKWSPPVALAIGPSVTPSGAPRCPEVRPKPLKERIHHFWESCRKESFIVCTSRYAVLKLDGVLNQDRRIYPRRSYGAGDFNIEIDTKLLRAGSNMVTITATDELKHISTASVGVTYTRDRTWPRRYSVKWCCVSQPTHVVQIVDGRWTATPDGFRTVSMAMTAYLRSVTWRGQTSRSPYQSQLMRPMSEQVTTRSAVVRGLAFSCTGVGTRLTKPQNVSAHNPAAAHPPRVH